MMDKNDTKKVSKGPSAGGSAASASNGVDTTAKMVGGPSFKPSTPFAKLKFSDQRKAIYSSIRRVDFDPTSKTFKFTFYAYKGDASKGLKPSIYMKNSKGFLSKDDQVFQLLDWGFDSEQVEAFYYLYIADESKGKDLFLALFSEFLLAFGNEDFIEIKEIKPAERMALPLAESPSTPSIARKAFHWPDKLIVKHPEPVIGSDNVTAHENQSEPRKEAEKRAEKKRPKSPEPVTSKDFTHKGAHFKAGEISSLATPKMLNFLSEYKKIKKQNLKEKIVKLEQISKQLDLPDSGNDDFRLWCAAAIAGLKNATPEFRKTVETSVNSFFADFKKGRTHFFNTTFAVANYNLEKIRSGFIQFQNLPPVKDSEGNIVEMGFGQRMFEVGSARVKMGTSYAAAVGKSTAQSVSTTTKYGAGCVSSAAKSAYCGTSCLLQSIKISANNYVRKTQWLRTKSAGKRPVDIQDGKSVPATDEEILEMASRTALPNPTVREITLGYIHAMIINPIKKLVGWFS